MEENNFTLEQMRSEYQVLKDALSKQEIVNDRLLRQTMKSQVRSIRSTATVSVVCAVFVILVAPVVFHYNPLVNASWWFVAATELVMALCIFMDWKFNHKVQNTDLNSCDLLSFSKNVRQMKNDYRGWIKWSVMIVIAWGAWLILEVLAHAEDPSSSIPFIVGLVIGLAVGGIVGYRMDRRIINTCDDIISQIES